jgi:tRNA-specific 2-thiouridylase
LSSVVLAISGGVDSSVAAALLKEEGYEVVGITFKNFNLGDYSLDPSPKNCCSIETLNKARIVCDKLSIPHYVINRVDQFEKEVIANFKQSYEHGITPNPCVRCNSLVRWPELIHLADDLGIEFVATGHYAQIADVNNRLLIKRAEFNDKDQTYALWGIKRQYLARTLFPVGKYAKQQIREIAAKYNFADAGYVESQDICFVPDGDYTNVVGISIPGEIVDVEGCVLGKHKGLLHYTIGQRRGLGISSPEPLYVLKIDLDNNRLIVGTEKQIFNSRFTVKEANWFVDISSNEKIKSRAKIRYRHEPAACSVIITGNDKMEVVFDEPQRAITPGQSAVFYDNQMLLGGGVIEAVFE